MTLAHLTLAFLLLGLPGLAQETTISRPPSLDQAQQKLRELAPTEAQAQGILEIFLGQLPRIMDENADPMSLLKEVAPQAERLLDRDQVEALRLLSEETGPLTQFGTMTREERRALVQGGLERLSHPDMKEWLRRLDSFEI